MPMLVLGLAALTWIGARWARLQRDGGGAAALARRDLAVGVALAASWLALWGLYAAYYRVPGGSTLTVTRHYAPALGAISLLGAWLVARLPRPARLPPRARPATATATTAIVIAVMLGLGVRSFHEMVASAAPGGGSGTLPAAPGQRATAIKTGSAGRGGGTPHHTESRRGRGGPSRPKSSPGE